MRDSWLYGLMIYIAVLLLIVMMHIESEIRWQRQVLLNDLLEQQTPLLERYIDNKFSNYKYEEGD